MRKIILINEIDPVTFLPKVILKEKLSDGSVVVHLEELLVLANQKYSKEELSKINDCNTILASKGLAPLTDDEADYMLDPEGFNKRLDALETEMQDSETLQKLAGFKVEKRIISLD